MLTETEKLLQKLAELRSQHPDLEIKFFVDIEVIFDYDHIEWEVWISDVRVDKVLYHGGEIYFGEEGLKYCVDLYEYDETKARKLRSKMQECIVVSLGL